MVLRVNNAVVGFVELDVDGHHLLAAVHREGVNVRRMAVLVVIGQRSLDVGADDGARGGAALAYVHGVLGGIDRLIRRGRRNGLVARLWGSARLVAG